MSGLLFSRSPPADQLLAAIVASSDDAVISKTMDGVVTSWNASAERIFGYGAAEMIGGPIAILAAPGREEEMSDIMARIRRGEKVEHFETTRRRKDGVVIPVSLTVSPIFGEGGVLIGASKVVRDISAARAATDALKQAEAYLEQQREELLHAARLAELGQMTAVLTHEVTQPISAIGAYLRAAQRLRTTNAPGADGKIDEAIEKACGQAERAGAIIQRLRSFSKATDGDRQCETIDRLLDEALSLATLDSTRRGVRVRRRTPPGPVFVVVDHVQIQQVLLNLIRNAFDAMDDCPRRELDLDARITDEGVEVRIADSGKGIAPEIKDRLFQTFATTKANGMGIGLSVSNRIILDHGGRLWAEDNPGGGAIFAFSLPIEQRP